MRASLLLDSSINLYMDSNNCIASLTMGDTPCDFLAVMVAVFWKMCQFYPIDIWIGRVRSKLNIADLLTKRVKLPLRMGKTEDPPNRVPLLLQCVEFTQNQPLARIGTSKKAPYGTSPPRPLALHARWRKF